jgi:hypothetical protein
MSTKFDIEDTLAELINNNFLLFENDLNLSKILWITRPENVLRVLVLPPRLGALATQYHIIFWTSDPNNYNGMSVIISLIKRV